MSIITYLNPDAIQDRSITKEKIDASVLDAKQDSLVSGTNIKTINGKSILGSGDITITSNVMAVDTGDIINDATVEYATKSYVDRLVGDINSVLESIING